MLPLQVPTCSTVQVPGKTVNNNYQRSFMNSISVIFALLTGLFSSYGIVVCDSFVIMKASAVCAPITALSVTNQMDDGDGDVTATPATSTMTSVLLDRILQVAIDASKKAGDIILGYAGGAEVTERKANSRDLLTLIDPLCEQVQVEFVLYLLSRNTGRSLNRYSNILNRVDSIRLENQGDNFRIVSSS